MHFVHNIENFILNGQVVTVFCAPFLDHILKQSLTVLHSEWPKLCGVLADLSARGLTVLTKSDYGLPVLSV